LIVQGEEAWQTISEYVSDVAPDLGERVRRHGTDADLFHQLRVDEQLAKALDRKVWLPSGGSLVIDRTEAMTVVDVNTGKYIGSGGNLEQTVTRNNLEAAEEIVHQLRLRDVGGIVVIDFIDMVLESNRDLVLRRLTECLGRDRTKHQVGEVTSLGLVQMTRKRVGEGLLEAFSEPCEVCHGRGVILHSEPVDIRGSADLDDEPPARRRSRRPAVDVPVEDLEQMDPAQRRAAASAMALIHRATQLDESDDTDEPIDSNAVEADAVGSTELDSDEIESPDLEVADEDDADLIDIDGDAGPLEFAGPIVDEVDRQAPPVAEPTSPADSADVSDWVAAMEPSLLKVPAPRRRRGASRPAGPPVAAH
jgi:ribonuclease E